MRSLYFVPLCLWITCGQLHASTMYFAWEAGRAPYTIACYDLAQTPQPCPIVSVLSPAACQAREGARYHAEATVCALASCPPPGSYTLVLTDADGRMAEPLLLRVDGQCTVGDFAVPLPPPRSPLPALAVLPATPEPPERISEPLSPLPATLAAPSVPPAIPQAAAVATQLVPDSSAPDEPPALLRAYLIEITAIEDAYLASLDAYEHAPTPDPPTRARLARAIRRHYREAVAAQHRLYTETRARLRHLREQACCSTKTVVHSSERSPHDD